jgi:hypothetical protein
VLNRASSLYLSSVLPRGELNQVYGAIHHSDNATLHICGFHPSQFSSKNELKNEKAHLAALHSAVAWSPSGWASQNVFAAPNLARLLEARFEHARAANFPPPVEVYSAPRVIYARTVLQTIFAAPKYSAAVGDVLSLKK